MDWRNMKVHSALPEQHMLEEKCYDAVLNELKHCFIYLSMEFIQCTWQFPYSNVVTTIEVRNEIKVGDMGHSQTKKNN